jgi:opacity protein-like surface antigen
MNGSLRFNAIRMMTAIAVLAVFTLGFGSGIAMADDVGGEDIVVPPPAPAPAPPPPPPQVEEDKYTLYVAGLVGYSWAKGEAGGASNFPTNANPNKGSDWDQTVFGAGTLGLKSELGPVAARVEIEGQGGRKYGFKTKGPLFSSNDPYNLKVSTYAFFANLFMDVHMTEKADWYLGGGIGAGIHDFTLNNNFYGVNSVSHDDAQWAFQVGTGFSYDVIDWLTLDLGYRYVSFGKVDVDLPGPLGGDYKLKLTSHDAVLGVRINYYSF